jgi:general stress protein 26
MEKKNDSANFEKLREMLKDIDFCMFTTVDEDGDLHSRPMSLNGEVDENGNLWFFTSAGSEKVSEVTAYPRCNASFAKPDDSRYVSISGSAEIVRDRKKIEELWKPELKIWFPEGTDEPDLALLRVAIDKAEYWDSPGGKVAQVISFVSALIKGESADWGENEKLELK